MGKTHFPIAQIAPCRSSSVNYNVIELVGCADPMTYIRNFVRAEINES